MVLNGVMNGSLRVDRYNEILAAVINLEPNEPVPTARLARLLRRSSEARSIAASLRADTDIEAVQVALGTLEENFSRLTAKLEIIHGNNVEQPSSPKGRLQEPTRTFAEVARKAAELAEDIKSLEPKQRVELRSVIDALLAGAFGSAASTKTAPIAQPNGLPSEAPELWADRKEHGGETAIGFLQRVYKPWLENLKLAHITELDHPLYQALQTWRRRHKVPNHLKAFFARERRTGAEVDAELKKYKIKKPEDAFARFPGDKNTANRLYQAAAARLKR